MICSSKYLLCFQHKEAEFLQKLLPGYYMNLNQNPHTLLPKFFGMYTYQCNQKNIRVTIMNNLLPSNIKMHLKFDLKGSTFKRKVRLFDILTFSNLFLKLIKFAGVQYYSSDFHTNSCNRVDIFVSRSEMD